MESSGGSFVQTKSRVDTRFPKLASKYWPVNIDIMNPCGKHLCRFEVRINSTNLSHG